MTYSFVPAAQGSRRSSVADAGPIDTQVVGDDLGHGLEAGCRSGLGGDQRWRRPARRACSAEAESEVPGSVRMGSTTGPPIRIPHDETHQHEAARHIDHPLRLAVTVDGASGTATGDAATGLRHYEREATRFRRHHQSRLGGRNVRDRSRRISPVRLPQEGRSARPVGARKGREPGPGLCQDGPRRSCRGVPATRRAGGIRRVRRHRGSTADLRAPVRFQRRIHDRLSDDDLGVRELDDARGTSRSPCATRPPISPLPAPIPQRNPRVIPGHRRTSRWHSSRRRA